MEDITQPDITDYLLPIGTQKILVLDPTNRRLAEISATPMGGISCMAKGIYTNTGRISHYQFTGTVFRHSFKLVVRNQGGHLAVSVDCDLSLQISAELPKASEPGPLHFLRNGVTERLGRLMGGPIPIRNARVYDFDTGREI